MPLDFPSNPTNGQVYNNFYYNSARGAWNALLPAATPNFFTNATLNTSTLIDATATSSLISTTPLVVKGISGQTANLQQWQDPAGSVIAFVDANGRGRFLTGLFGNAASPIGANLNIIPTTNSTLGLVIRGVSSQTADLQQFQLSDSTLQSRISPSGSFVTKQGSYISASDGSIKSVVDSATVTPLIVQAAASQTADLQQWQSSTGAVLSDINSAGELQVPRIGIGSVMPTTTHLFVNSAAAANIPIIAQGAASQTSDLQRWQNSSGTVLADVDSLGNIQAPKLGLGGSAPPTSPSSTNLQVTGRAKILSNGSESAGVWLTGSSNVDTAFIGQFNTDTTSPVGIYHNGGWRLLVDSSGRVTKPSQPSFQAVKTTHTTASAYLIFNSVYHNTGNAYNSSNGRFTAPVPGRYLFTFTTLLYNMGSSSNVYLLINGVQQAFMGTYGQFSGSYAGQGATQVVNLNANDYVEWYFTHNGTSLHLGYTNASAYFLG
jgi:hypothetical protein